VARPPILERPGSTLFKPQLERALDYIESLSGGGSPDWGDIGGTLSAQTDLQSALDGKQPLATVLTNTTAAFTTAQETKLAGLTPWAIRILNATQSMANDTSVQDWFATAGGLPLLADSTYEFEGHFFSLNGATSHGLNMQFAAIAGASIQWNAIGSKVNLTTQSAAQRFTATNTFATNRLVTTASTVTGNAVRAWGTVVTTTAGTLIPRVAQSAASGSFTVQPGTYFKARRIGADTLTNTGEWT
jgi:hypothetical protein